MTEQLNAIQAVERVRDNLAESGLPRTSKLAGGEITGWTSNLGHTGFSIRKNGPGITWSFPISGKPHLEYREVEDDGEEPINPDELSPRITDVFKNMGLSVHDVRCVGASLKWDDDVYYEVTTNKPAWLTETA